VNVNTQKIQNDMYKIIGFIVNLTIKTYSSERDKLSSPHVS